MPEENVKVHRATATELEALAPLFDAYRVFYRQPSDLETARAFLGERLALPNSSRHFRPYRRGGSGFSTICSSCRRPAGVGWRGRCWSGLESTP